MSITYRDIPREQAEQELAKELGNSLSAGKRVLLLVSGGSNLQSAVTVLDSIDAALKPALTITLVDERYGAVGHKDSNLTGLQQVGLNPDERVIPVLIEQPLEQTVEHFYSLLTEAIAASDEIFALLGIGSDGHIAGILPDQEVVNTRELVVGYTGPDYTRISISLEGLTKVNHAYVLAYGANKVPALRALGDESSTLSAQPSQILHKLPDVRIYNELIGGDRT